MAGLKSFLCPGKLVPRMLAYGTLDDAVSWPQAVLILER